MQERLHALAISSRKRRGRGGGREYPISALPQAAQDVIAAKMAPVVPAVVRPAMAKPIVEMKDWQKRVLDARASVLLAIADLQVRAAVRGKELSWSAAIESFLCKLKAGELAPELQELVRVANNRVGKREKPLSRSTIYNWRNAREAMGGVGGLAPKAVQEDGPPAWLGDFLKHWALPQKPSIRTALENWAKAETGLALPSYSQARRALKTMDNRLRIAGRMGHRERKRMLAYVARGTEDLWSTAIYTADGHTFKAQCAHPRSGRPFRVEVTPVLDVYSRKIVSRSIGQNENSWDVTAAIAQAFLSHGVCAFFYVDNGAGFNNMTLDARATGILSRFDVGKENSIAYNAQARGLIERINNTIFVKAAKGFPTYCGDDMDEEARQRMYRRVSRDVRDMGSSPALPSFEETVAAIDQAIDEYNNRPHSALPTIADPVTGRRRSMTPNEMWAEGLAKARQLGMPLEVVEPHAVFELWPSKIRKTSRGLVDCNGESYFAQDLEAFHGEDVEVRFNPNDPAFVIVVPSRGVPIRAELDGNKRPYLPKSVIEQQVERRGLNAIKRGEAKVERIRALHQDHLLQGAPKRPLIEIPAEERERHEVFVANYEPIRIRTERDEENEKRDAMRRWLSIENAIAAGIAIAPDDRAFHARFRETSEFKSFQIFSAEELPVFLGEIPTYRNEKAAPHEGADAA
jgi:putative transposase